MEAHEYCLLFPSMSAEEFSDLCRDMSKKGLLDAIITYQGSILDGRHRHKACGLLDIVPRYEEWNGQGGSPLEYVVSRNLHRRNLEPGQRAAIAVDVKKRLEIEYRERMVTGGKSRAKAANTPKNNGFAKNCEPIPKGGDSRKAAAEMMGVNHQYVSDAERIQETSPETFEEVKAGKKTIPQAKRELGIGVPSKPSTVDRTVPKEEDLTNPRTELDDKVIEYLSRTKNKYKQFAGTEDIVSGISNLMMTIKTSVI